MGLCLHLLTFETFDQSDEETWPDHRVFSKSAFQKCVSREYIFWKFSVKVNFLGSVISKTVFFKTCVSRNRILCIGHELGSKIFAAKHHPSLASLFKKNVQGKLLGGANFELYSVHFYQRIYLNIGDCSFKVS